MSGFENLAESVTSGLAVLYNGTLLSDILLSLRHEDRSLSTLLWPTIPYAVLLSVIATLLFTYYYMWLPINWIQDVTDIGYNDIKGAHQGRRSKKELVDEIQRRRQLGDLPPVYPNGWFSILESTDLKDGQVKHVQALGENFAVMRSSKGEVHVLDAYCPHLGANMAVGGVVKGDCLECPFHGWQFRGEDGTCSHIPYSDKVPKSAAVKKWTSNEVNGFVFVWYHAEGDPPSWQVESIPELQTGKLWYRGRLEMIVNGHLQDIAENSCDVSHVTFLHKTWAFAGYNKPYNNSLVDKFWNHDWKADWIQNSAPEESHISTTTGISSHRLFEKFMLLPTEVIISQIGPGYTVVLNCDWGCIVSTTTPVEPLMARMIFHFHLRPQRFLFFGIFIYAFIKMISRDVMVWNHKIHVRKPIIVKEDEALARYRRWFSQFYTEHSPRFSFNRDSMDW